MADHQVDIVGEVRNRLVDDGHITEARCLDLAPQDRGTHGRGAHARVAGEDDRANGLGEHGRATRTTGEGRRGDRLLALHRLHVRRRPAEVTLVLGLVGLQDERGDEEGRRSAEDPRERDTDQAGGGGLRVDGEDRARCGRRPQAGVEEDVDEDLGHTTGDHRDDQLRLGQDVGEVDLVDAADEVDEGSARGRGLGHALAEHHVGEQ